MIRYVLTSLACENSLGCGSVWSGTECIDTRCSDQPTCEASLGCDSVWTEYCDNLDCTDQPTCEASFGCGSMWNEYCDGEGYSCDSWNGYSETCLFAGCSWQNSCGEEYTGLLVELLDPSENANVTQNELFNFTANVTCIEESCGNVTVILNPDFPCNEGCVELEVNGHISYYDSEPRESGSSITYQQARDNCTALGGDMVNFDESYAWVYWYGEDSFDIPYYGYDSADTCNEYPADGEASCCGLVADADGFGYHDLYGCSCHECYSSSSSIQSFGHVCVFRDKGAVPMDEGNPFYTITQNPMGPEDLECLADMISEDTCEVTWEVNATGEHLSEHTFYVIYNSTDYPITFNSEEVVLTIIDLDFDDDGVNNTDDNCPLISNSGQEDEDSDLVGDVCDNCVLVSNFDQNDSEAVETEFAHSDYGDEEDCIESSVCITRDNSRPVYNSQSGGIEWACGMCGNETSSYYSEIEYLTQNYNNRDDWCISGGMINIPGEDTCLHIIRSDIYWNINWINWTSNNAGGGFSYNRTGMSDNIGDACDLCPGDTDNDGDDDGWCNAAEYLEGEMSGGSDNCQLIYNPGQADEDTNDIGDDCEHDGLSITENTTLASDIMFAPDLSYAISFDADNVTLDCAGYRLIGADGAGYDGIYAYERYGIAVKNCTIINFDQGIYLQSTTDSEFTDNTIKNNNNQAIYLEYSDNNLISDGEVGYNGIVEYGQGGIYLSESHENTISGIYMHNNKRNAIYSGQSNFTTIENNNIDENCGGESGIYLQNSANALVENNNVTRGTGHGIQSYYSLDSIISNNNITNNTYNGIYIYNWNNMASNIIENNIIDYNGDSGINGYYENDTIIRNNNIIGNEYSGIYLYEFNNATISDNNLTGNGYYGISLDRSPDNTITDNTIIGDTNSTNFNGYGIYVYGDSLYAENNYFSRNDVSGYYSGFYTYRVKNFTIDTDEYHNNSQGIYLTYTGSAENMPLINHTDVYDNEEAGMYLEYSNVSVENAYFANNGDSRTGVSMYYSDLYLKNGDFISNGYYGIYEYSGDSVYWTITERVLCENNDIYAAGGWISFENGSITATNCSIVIGDSYYLNQIDVGVNETATVGTDSFDLTIYSESGYSGIISVSVSDELPENTSGHSLNALGTWVSFDATELGAGDWAIIKIYYTDEQLTALGLDETSLVIQYYNETDGTWEIFDTPRGGRDSDDNGKYVWANTTHFSGFGVFGSLIPGTLPSGGASMAIGGANVTYVAPGEEGTQPEVPSESVVTPVGEIPTDVLPIIAVGAAALLIFGYMMLKPVNVKKKR